MFEFLKMRKPVLLGVDISSSAVKLLELSQQLHSYRVESYAVVPLSAGSMVEKSIKDPGMLANTISQAHTNSGSSLKHSAIAIADSSVITKILPIDSGLSDHEIEDHIMLEADKFIPYPLEEVSIDFDIIGASAKHPDYLDILVAASRSENVQIRVDTMDTAGLDVEVVDVESYAVERACRLMANALPNGGVDETVAIVDIGSLLTNLTVLYNMRTIFTREEVFGGALLTKNIQRHYGMNYAEAGLAKKQGNLPDDYANEVLAPFIQSAVLQVRRSLQFFFSASQHNKINHILLAGGTASLPDLATIIENEIGIPTSVANPFANMEISDRVDATALANDATSLLLCCGLALRSFDQHAESKRGSA